VAGLSFAVLARDGAARLGRLLTPHGVLDTPAFFPVGTFGAVRGLAPADLLGAGVQGVLSNTYHLHLRPGELVVRELGGLHRFMGWPGPMLTDSGGFQLHSLDHLARADEDGVRFKSPLDGSEHFLSPERAVEIQEALGADLIVCLDHFEPVSDPPDPARERLLLERTLRWAARCKAVARREDQWLLGIVQGGGSEALRLESAQRTAEIGFPAYAVGGLGLGESIDTRAALLEASLGPLAQDVPRYLMGIGTPEDLVEAVARGVDWFDCVVPTRNGRHGSVFTPDGPMNLRNARFRSDPAPIDPSCDCATCRTASRAYLRHLIACGEALGTRLASLHNLRFYMRLLADARAAIAEGRFAAWRSAFRARYRGASPATDSAA
jgi:queuine tRNA-ribosyltransferase